ncbi:MAG TPA: hypothetical protein VGJ79_06625 [Candidatus Dormibacteraeota bacterium]
MAESSDGPVVGMGTMSDDESSRFGPNTTEVEAFIQAVAKLTPAKWKKVLAVRKLVASVTKEGSGEAAGELQAIRAAMRSGEGRVSEPMTRAGEALFGAVEKQRDENVIAAWQAVSALVLRHQLSALKFAAHYAPFASLVPVLGDDTLDQATRRFLASFKWMSSDQCAMLARPWRLDPNSSRSLIQAVASSGRLNVEEAVALQALATIPKRLSGDAGWAAVRTAVHGGRVLSRRAELASAEVAALWAPLQEVIPLESLDHAGGHEDEPNRVRSVTRTAKAAKAPKVAAPRLPKATALYGPNSAEVAAFLKAVVELTPIQWLRVLDRRQLVSSVTREGSAEPASVVRALFAGIEGTKGLDTFTRCRAFAAVEQASFAVETKAAAEHEQVVRQFSPFAGLIPLEEVDPDEFVRRVASLNAVEWAQVAAAVPAVNEEVVAPLINAGTALIDFVSRRLDDEAVCTWHAISALVRRRQLTPIKFAASYAPFASAIPITGARVGGAMLTRYVTAIGRLGGSQCEVLAQPWQLSDEDSNALSGATKDGRTRPAEEAAALVAVVTVPMRLSGSAGWAAVKTAVFGGRVIASRARLTAEQIETLWKPIQSAIPLSSLGAPARSKGGR